MTTLSQQTDTTEALTSSEVAAPMVHSAPHEFKASDVLRYLPRSYTPAQQDSAVQTHLPHRTLVLSSKPDTLCIPGLKADRVTWDVKSIPRIYEENFFKNNPHLHPEVSGGAMGEMANPLPYTLRSDDVVTCTLLLCFFLMMLVFTRGRRFLTWEIKKFVYTTMAKEEEQRMETGGQLYGRLFLVFQTAFLGGILGFAYIQNYQTDFFNRVSPVLLLGSLVVACLTFVFAKWLTYNFVNGVFFQKASRVKWIDSYLLLVSLTGIVLFPIVLLIVYFDLNLQNVSICLLIVLILVKILQFWKCFSIFFAKNNGFLHLIVYFCALEIVPMLALWQIWELLSNRLIIIF
jgi:hypothetical protein